MLSLKNRMEPTADQLVERCSCQALFFFQHRLPGTPVGGLFFLQPLLRIVMVVGPTSRVYIFYNNSEYN